MGACGKVKRSMRLAIFTTATRPEQRGDTYTESLACYNDLADEVVIEGGHWPQEFNWKYIGQTFQKGYQAAYGDWVIHADLDFLFHEHDFPKIRGALREASMSPAVSFYKWQFILPDRYNLKSRLLIAVNKKVFGDRITFSGGGDLCQPQLDGRDINLDEMPQAGIPFYNYEKLTKTKEQIMDDVGRMDRAYAKYFGHFLYSKDGGDESAYEGWLEMVVGRFHKPSRHIKLREHPKYIQDTIRNLTSDQFGYSGFGLLGRNDYAS